MKPNLALLLLFPALLPAQALLPVSVPATAASVPATTPAPEEKYRDTVFSPGAIEGSAPLSAEEKIKLGALRTVAPRVFLGSLFLAGIQQAQNTPGRWGHGFDGYGKRYATDLGVNAMREAVASSLDAALHQEPRFFRSQKTDTRGRLKDALLQVVVAHTDSGGRALAYGNVLGAYGSAELAARWMPHSQSTVGDGLLYGTVLLAGDAARNVFREFWPDMKRKLKH